MIDRNKEERHLAEAEQHIAEAEENIRHQEKIIEKLQADGHSTEAARALLSTMQETLATMKNHRAFLMETLANLASSSDDSNAPPHRE